jgi:hypothetical protein
MLTKILMTLIALLVGGWMLFDGMHVMLRGKYFGPDKPGPWSGLFTSLGIDPFKLGPLFLAFGVLWIVVLMGLLCGQTWGRYGAIGMAIASLWYLPVGPVLSLVFLVLVFFSRSDWL